MKPPTREELAAIARLGSQLADERDAARASARRWKAAAKRYRRGCIEFERLMDNWRAFSRAAVGRLRDVQRAMAGWEG